MYELIDFGDVFMTDGDLKDIYKMRISSGKFFGKLSSFVPVLVIQLCMNKMRKVLQMAQSECIRNKGNFFVLVTEIVP